MATPPNPRLCKIIRELDRVARVIDDLHTAALEQLRAEGATWEELGECYDPPKSRQAVARWLNTRRQRQS